MDGILGEYVPTIHNLYVCVCGHMCVFVTIFFFYFFVSWNKRLFYCMFIRVFAGYFLGLCLCVCAYPDPES